jgi:DNA ligase (NAD+)
MNGVNAKLTNSFSGSLRGEIIMLKSVWKADFADKANPRNAASGVSKRLDSVGVEKLHILFYQALGDVDFKTELEQMQWLSTNGLAIPDYWHFNTIPEVNQHWRDYQDQQRAQLDYDIDGLVIRLNNLEAQLALGDKDLRPLGAIAFKFDNETRESAIREITWQVGNSGRLTPVATLDPVHLVGATITRASLYNLGYIQELGLDVGAKVLVARANDVIPRVEELVVGTGTVAQAPSVCPACQGVTKKEGENLVCTNTQNCRSQIIGRIKNWITELNLLEWGDTLVEKLVDSQKVTTVADLYRLQPTDIANLDRLGDKTAKKCLDILWSQVNLPLEVFLAALSIPLIGQSTIKAIINEGCDTLEKFGQLDAEAFAQVPGVGPTKAKSLADGLKTNQSLILDLLGAGISIKDKVQGKLTGCRIAITGSTKHKRADLEKFIMDHGGENKSSVGKSCTHLVIADTNSTSAKAVAARKLGIVLVNEDSLLNLTI